MTAMRSAISNSSSSSSETTRTAVPAFLRSRSAWRIAMRRADIDTPCRLRDDQHIRLLQHLAPDDELLQIAAREAGRRGVPDRRISRRMRRCSARRTP